MKFLFVHQNFPGQFLHIVQELARSGEHQIVFITEPNDNVIQGVQKVPYLRPALPPVDSHPAARELEAAVRRAEVVGNAAATLKHLGFNPDIIIGHQGWGEMLNLRDLWPKTPILGYMEFYYHPDSFDIGFDAEFPVNESEFPRIRAKNAVNHIALNLNAHGQTPTDYQLSTYPDWAKPQITLLREGVHLDVCKPDAAARKASFKVGDMTIRSTDKLVTYVSRDLEPYRGFHSMMRTLPALLAKRKDIKVVMVGGDGISYGTAPAGGGTWREVMMREVGDRIDLKRVVFPGKVPYELYLRLLKRSDAHVYLTYPFVLSWSLREALATGCAVIGGDCAPVREFITHDENGLLASFFDYPALADTIVRVIEDQALNARLRLAARKYAEDNLSMETYLAEYKALISRLTGTPLTSSATPPKPKRGKARTKAVADRSKVQV